MPLPLLKVAGQLFLQVHGMQCSFYVEQDGMPVRPLCIFGRLGTEFGLVVRTSDA
jgi:hypothetical protein